jgi:beta-lactamase class A
VTAAEANSARVQRSRFIVSAAACGIASLVVPSLPALAAAVGGDPFAAIEREYGGTVGIAAQVVGSERAVMHRAGERFPLASTWKLPLVMAVLARVQAGRLSLDRAVPFTSADLARFGSIAEEYLRGGKLSVREICRRTISYSDNTGADLLAPLAGGPAAVNRYVRALGIGGISIDHRERELPATAVRANPHDSGTPRAMMRLAERLVTRSPLAPAETSLLLSWLRATKTGDKRLRAGVPVGWTVADKTGTYDNAFNDVGLLYPPSGPPIAIACYAFGQPGTSAGERIIADCARAVVRILR